MPPLLQLKRGHKLCGICFSPAGQPPLDVQLHATTNSSDVEHYQLYYYYYHYTLFLLRGKVRL
jgi:hypothetical protein